MLRMLGQLFAKKSLLHFAFISINLDIFNTKFDCLIQVAEDTVINFQLLF